MLLELAEKVINVDQVVSISAEDDCLTGKSCIHMSNGAVHYANKDEARFMRNILARKVSCQ